jgi:3-phosphoshikimate 1-carboxyvinyltransferase
VDESSQFASALLLSGRPGGWKVQITGANTEELPYVEMTRKLIEAFPHNGGDFQIEPDASSGSYFWGAGWLLDRNINVVNWPTSGWQIDQAFPGAAKKFSRANLTKHRLSRERDLGDSIMTAIALGPFASQTFLFEDLGRLRVQECERVFALRTELGKCGATVRETGDTLEILPGPLHGAEIETYNDHRMAMCFSILGLKVPGIKIKNPACVKKTFPNFFQKLAAPAPEGLGVEIRDVEGRVLKGDELFAE